MAIITDDFGAIIEGAIPEAQDILDTRHAVYARKPTYTIDSYLRYIQFCKLLVMSSGGDPLAKGSDYMLLLGYVPVVMPPSFWDDKAHRMILPALYANKLEVVPRPAISFTHPYYRADFSDYWVSKLDAARLCNCKPEYVTVEGVLRRCGL